MIYYFAFQQTVTLCEDLLHDKLSYATNDRMVLMRRVLIKADEDFGSFLNLVSKISALSLLFRNAWEIFSYK